MNPLAFLLVGFLTALCMGMAWWAVYLFEQRWRRVAQTRKYDLTPRHFRRR